MFRGVYRGRLPVAAKRLLETPDEAAAAADFDREVLVLAQLAHPCVLVLFGLCDDPNGNLMVTPFLLLLLLLPPPFRAGSIRICRPLWWGAQGTDCCVGHSTT